MQAIDLYQQLIRLILGYVPQYYPPRPSIKDLLRISAQRDHPFQANDRSFQSERDRLFQIQRDRFCAFL